jgi:hypothetical protein
LDPGVAPSLVFTIAVVAARVHRVRADHKHARADLRAAVRNPSQRDQEGQSQELALQLHSLFLGMHPNYDLISWVQHCKIGKYLFQSLVILCPNTTYLQGLPKYTRNGIFGMQIYHPTTLVDGSGIVRKAFGRIRIIELLCLNPDCWIPANGSNPSFRIR